MQLVTLEESVRDYVNEIKTSYEDQIKELQVQYEYQEHQIHKLKIDVNEYQWKYLEIKERYDLLVYKRFMRSAEQIPADKNQVLLFASEEKETEAVQKEEQQEKTEVKSHQRKKPGRKPLDPSLPREEIIIDIPEEEKICACGEKLTRIGEETSEKLEIIPEKIV